MDISLNMTLTELADKEGRTYESVRKMAVRKFPGRPWTKDTELSGDEVRELSTDKKISKRTKRKTGTNTQTDKSAGHESAGAKREGSGLLSKIAGFIISQSFSIVCISIVIGHAGLIWYDVANLWGTPGKIGGFLSFLIVLAAVMAAHNGKKQSTSAIAMVLVLGLDIAAYWVHYPTFLQYSTANPATTQGICIFLCSLSFGAFLLFRNSKIEVEW